MGDAAPQRTARPRTALLLASASPRRSELLARAGQHFEVEPSGVEERATAEAPATFAARVARDKAAEVSHRKPGRWVLAADTIVTIDGDILGKPGDAAEAAHMLRRLSGRRHVVITAFVLLGPAGEIFREAVVETEVAFRELTDGEIGSYVASGEPFDKAGAYAIQGGGGGFVRELRGSHSNVVGLPLDEVRRALIDAGLWRNDTGAWSGSES